MYSTRESKVKGMFWVESGSPVIYGSRSVVGKGNAKHVRKDAMALICTRLAKKRERGSARTRGGVESC